MTICPYEPRDVNRPCQGALYRDIETLLNASVLSTSEEPELVQRQFPYAIALSQECDLDQDHANRVSLSKMTGPKDGEKNQDHDKLLPAVLMCPAYETASFRDGTHLEDLERKMSGHARREWDVIKQNRNPRYHFLCEWPPLQVPELVIDFKHYFTVPTELVISTYATEQHYIARLTCPYREDLSQRFAAYLTRIGLPTPHHQIRAPAS